MGHKMKPPTLIELDTASSIWEKIFSVFPLVVIGRVISARIAEEALRTSGQDDEDLVFNAPLLAYLYPGRFAEISSTTQLPFPAGFKR